MPTLQIGLISKKINSTKQTFTSSYSYDCKLKDDCGMQSPVFIVQNLSKSTLYNYAKFENKYYWIDDIIYLTNNLQEVHCHLDPLATYKDDIKACNAFVNFGPKSAWYRRLVDTRCQPELVMSSTNGYLTFDDVSTDGAGAVIIRIVDFPVNGGTSPGGVQTLCGTLSDFQTLLSLYCSDLTGDIANFSTDFEKTIGKIAGLGNALDSIKSAVWVPFKLSKLQSGTAYSGNIGGYSINTGWQWCNHWAGNPFVDPQTLDIPTSLLWQTYPWLLDPKYSKLSILTPGGQMDISDSIFNYYDVQDISLDFRLLWNIDGECTLICVDKDSNKTLAMQTWSAAVDLKSYIYKAKNATLSGIGAGLKIGAAGVAAIGGVGAAAMAVGNTVSSAVGSAAANAGNDKLFDAMAKAQGKKSKTINTSFDSIASGISGMSAAFDCAQGAREFGGPNGIGAFYVNTNTISEINKLVKWNLVRYAPDLIYTSHYDEFCDEYGWPVSDYMTLSVDGPYQCAGASVTADAPPNVLSTINSFLNSYIIIE